MPEQIAITKRSGVPGMLKVLPVVTFIMLVLLFSVSPCLANEGQAGVPSYDTSGYNMNFGWKDGGPTTPVESPPENQTPAQQPPAPTQPTQQPVQQPASQPTPTQPGSPPVQQPASQPTPTQPNLPPVQQPVPQPASTQPAEGANQQGPPTPVPGDDLNFEWSDQGGAQDSLPQDASTPQSSDPQPEQTELGEGVNQQGPPAPDPGDDLNFEWSDQEDTQYIIPQDSEIKLSPPGTTMSQEADYIDPTQTSSGDTSNGDVPWWIEPLSETIMDALDYAPTNNVKAIYNTFDNLINGEPIKAVQEIASIPLGWVGTFIGHAQKAAGLELSMDNLEKWLGKPPKPQEPVKPPENRQNDPNWWLSEEQPLQ